MCGWLCSVRDRLIVIHVHVVVLRVAVVSGVRRRLRCRLALVHFDAHGIDFESVWVQGVAPGVLHGKEGVREGDRRPGAAQELSHQALLVPQLVLCAVSLPVGPGCNERVKDTR